jgi:hypothetical protein
MESELSCKVALFRFSLSSACKGGAEKIAKRETKRKIAREKILAFNPIAHYSKAGA